MGKKKLDPAALAEAFRNFQNTPECKIFIASKSNTYFRRFME